MAHLPGLGPSMSLSDRPPFCLCICLIVHIGGTLIMKRLRDMLMRKCFIGLCFILYTPLSHKHCTYALSSQLKASKYYTSWVVLLCDNFTAQFFSILNIGVKSMVNTGKTQRDGMEREAWGRIGMGNTCKSMADSCQCMAKTTRIL